MLSELVPGNGAAQSAPVSERPATGRRLCATVARERGENPVGSAWATERMFVIEVPLPWPGDLFTARELPPGLEDVILAMYEEHPDWGMVGIAPDRSSSREGWSRVIDFAFPAPPRAAQTRTEFLVRNEVVAPFLRARIEGEPSMNRAGVVESVDFDGRDLLVCTHGTVDACCALFGYPLYRDLRRSAEASGGAVRVWRSTHFGGHRFAPTVLDLPQGRYWGWLDPQLGELLVNHRGEVAALAIAYRGWAGYADPAAQVLEREALLREGWAWTTWPQSCVELDRDARGAVLLSITAYPPTGPAITYQGLVEPGGDIETLYETDGEPVRETVLRVRDLSRWVTPVERAAVVPRLEEASFGLSG